MEEIEGGSYERHIPIYEAMAMGLLQRAFGACFDIANLQSIWWAPTAAPDFQGKAVSMKCSI